LLASGQISLPDPRKCAFIGELGLKGDVRGVRGIIGKLLAGRDQGITDFYIAPANLGQATLVPGINLYPVGTLKELVQLLDGSIRQPAAAAAKAKSTSGNKYYPASDPFADIVGQAVAKRALEIAAAGGHNVLFSGPPGTGKTMLAKSLPFLLPALNQEETLEVSKLHSLVSSEYDKAITTRPFRAPHHSASHVAITGGGNNLRPGEVSLSHRGVLFLDELPEFNRLTLEALRQPLEDRTISVTRAKDSVDYPANFILIATANPCHCGYYGSSKTCSCLPHQIQRYQQLLSGPILDLIELFAHDHEEEHAKLLTPNTTPSSNRLSRISDARQRQHARFGAQTKLNADMTNADIKKLARLQPEAKQLLDTAGAKLDLSARSYMRIVKLARTIADLAGSKDIEASHIAEALQFRPQLVNL
jgi:magnesium chelatase family protein